MSLEGEFSPKIEARSAAFGPDVQAVSRLLGQVNSSLMRYLGGYGFLSKTVERVSVRDASMLSNLTEPDVLGEWDGKRRRINIFANRFGGKKVGPHEEKRTWEETLRHELGHVYFSQLIGLENDHMLDHQYKKGRVSSRVGREAFAEWIRIILESAGDADAVDKRFNSVINDPMSMLLDRVDRRLFSSGREKVYPRREEKLRDAAILNYLYRLYGMTAVIGLCQEMTKRVSYKSLFLRGFFEWRKLSDVERNDLVKSELSGMIESFDQYFMNRFRKTPHEIYTEARVWYTDHQFKRKTRVIR